MVARLYLRFFMILLALLFASACSASRTRADEWYSYYQAVCAPDLGYFHFQSIAVDNAPSWHVFDDKLRPQGVFPLSDLGRENKCDLGWSVMTFGGVERVRNPIEDDATFWLAVNGKVVYETKGLFWEGNNGRFSTAITADTLQVEVCRGDADALGELHLPRKTGQVCTTVYRMPYR
jgi:hypothetical protein